MAGPRRSSTSNAPPALLDSLPLVLKLILAQAVYQAGTQDWKTVTAILKGQPALVGVKPVLKPETAKRAFQAMMVEAELDSELTLESVGAVELEVVAELYYQRRIAELHALMNAQAEKFRAAYTDLTDIQQGKWDDRRPGASPALPDDLPPLPSTSAPPSSRTRSPRAAAAALPPTATKATSNGAQPKSPKSVAVEQAPAAAKMRRNSSARSAKADVEPPTAVTERKVSGRRRSGRGKADDVDEDVEMELDS